MLCDTCKNKGCCGLYSDVEDLKAELISCKKYIYSPVEEVTADAPAVDAVEVVRCKDCVNLRKSIEGYNFCAKWDVDSYEEATVRFDDFCSYGERRKSEE